MERGKRRRLGLRGEREVEKRVHGALAGLTAALTSHPYVCGFCYTQLTDVEQEQNGLLKYDRTPKFDLEAIRKIIAAPAKIEQ